jgi:hypothetical protein
MRKLLRGGEVADDLTRRAGRIAAAAGAGHEVETTLGRNRVYASVVTATFEARKAESGSRNLTRSIDAGR